MDSETYAELEQRLQPWTTAAAAGDLAAEAHLAAALADLAAAPPSEGWPRPGSIAFTVFDEFLDAAPVDPAVLRRLVPAFLTAIAAHPETLGLPHGFQPAESLGPSAIPLLTDLLDRGLARTTPAAIEALGHANPLNDVGFKLASEAAERLFAYTGVDDDVAAAWLALPWTDARLWLLFRILAYNGPAKLGATARAVLPRLIAATAALDGPGARQLRASLLRAKIIPKSLAPGITPARLPRKLPLTVAEALALLDTWKLSASDVGATPPARPRELAALADKLGRSLPRELTRLLTTHAAIGVRDLGPPARMRQLVRELAETIEEDEEESDEVPTSRGSHDVRGFDLKKAIPLGSDPGGDLYFLATGARSSADAAPVIRFRHDQALVATVAADSLGEYVALVFARAYARREGLEPELDRLEFRRRTIVSGYKRPKPKSDD